MKHETKDNKNVLAIAMEIADFFTKELKFNIQISVEARHNNDRIIEIMTKEKSISTEKMKLILSLASKFHCKISFSVCRATHNPRVVFTDFVNEHEPVPGDEVIYSDGSGDPSMVLSTKDEHGIRFAQIEGDYPNTWHQIEGLKKVKRRWI